MTHEHGTVWNIGSKPIGIRGISVFLAEPGQFQQKMVMSGSATSRRHQYEHDGSKGVEEKQTHLDRRRRVDAREENAGDRSCLTISLRSGDVGVITTTPPPHPRPHATVITEVVVVY